MMISHFIADSGPAVRIAPAEVFHIGALSITNSMLYGWLCMTFIIIFLIMVARRVTVHPKGGIVQFVEAGAEFIMQMITSGFNNKAEARKHMPYFVTLFFFLLLNNWLGLVPGVGEALTVHGVPLLRPFTADFNATLAAAAVTMIYVYSSSIRSFGGLSKYLRHFFVGSPFNPMFFVIGLLEMITDLMRVLSLSLRLFLNVTIGEIIIAVFAYLGHQIAPLSATPFTLIELFVGALQAYIFTTLSTMYLSAAVNHAGHDTHSETTDPETVTAEFSTNGSHA
jgi:F-type H+-transporting ATPase subunit a